MVVFTKTGIAKLIDCAMGRSKLVITGDIAEFTDELSILLTKVNYTLGKEHQGLFYYEDPHYILGSGEEIHLDAKELFSYFEVTHVMSEIPQELINSRNTGLCYNKALGEVMMLNTIFNSYIFNDGSVVSVDNFTSSQIIPLKKDAMLRCMPDLHLEVKKAEKVHKAELARLNLVGITDGSKIRILPYADLVTKYGEQMIVMDENDNAVLVDISDNSEAIRFIKHLGYSKMSADYYDNKEGTIEHIDILTGSLVINIDGKTTHTMFMDDGEARSNSGEGIVFTLEHIAKV